MAIKRSLNRDDFDFQSEDIEQLARETGFAELPLRSAHCHAVCRMPWQHRDPFDRLLVAQAQFLFSPPQPPIRTSPAYFRALCRIDRLVDIEKTTIAYREEIRKRVAGTTSISSCPETIILNYLDRYANHLFGHPARRDEHGRIIAVAERTNNVAEHFFGADKQKLRRRLGRANLGRDLEDQPAQAALASNLRHPDYVRLVSGSLENLPAAFAKLDQEQYREVAPLQRSNKDTKLLKRIKVLVADERLQRNNAIIAQQTRPLETSVTEF